MIKLRGKVKKGNSRGKALGYPTANINLFKDVPQGIYISKTKVNGKEYNSLTFIGNATTFNETKIKAETYILDFDSDIYGKFISISLLKKIRGNIKFKSEKELVEQMNKDLKAAKNYFKKG